MSAIDIRLQRTQTQTQQTQQTQRPNPKKNIVNWTLCRNCLNLSVCSLQSRLQHIYHGQSYARVDLNPIPESTVSTNQGLWIWPQYVHHRTASCPQRVIQYPAVILISGCITYWMILNLKKLLNLGILLTVVAAILN